MKTLILAAIFISANSLACSCPVFPKIEDVVNKAELILQGTTLKHYVDVTRQEEEFDFGRKVNYAVNRVTKVLKDEVKLKEYFEKTLKIQTLYASVDNGANCGTNLYSKPGTDYILIIPQVEKSDFGYAKLPLYYGVSFCTSYQYILNTGKAANTYRYVKSLLEK